MSKSAMVRARIEPGLKEDAEKVLGEIGLNATQAITLFYKQVELHQGLPFDVVIPNETTQRTFRKTDDGRGLVVCKDADDLLNKLGL